MNNRRKTNTVKRGSLSNEEKQLIQDWAELKSDQQIASDLKRTIKQVASYKAEYLASAPAITVRRTEAEELRRELKGKPEWVELDNQFSSGELLYFENQYIAYRQELKDITPQEFTQLKHLITLDILMNRHNAERKRSQADIERLEKLLEKEYSKSDLLREPELITQMETNLQANRAASSQRVREYKDLLDKHQSIMKDLKSTREQRIKNLDQRGKFLDVLKALALDDTRRLVDEEIGLYNVAIDTEKKRLSQHHLYQDNTVDRVLLTSETING